MVQLFILGSSELRDVDGKLEQSFLSGPKRLALLAYLALDTPGFKHRDRLLPLFWPESGQKSARNALSNMLYHMRKALGNDIVRNRGKEEIGLGDIWCDAGAFEEALKKGNAKKALELYRGNLLDGLYVPDASPEFQQWLDLEREQYKRKYQKVLKTLAAKAEKRGDLETAVNRWYQLSREDPYNSKIIKRLTEALAAADKRPEALRVARNHAQLLEKELAADASEEFKKLAKNLDDSSKISAIQKKSIKPEDLNPHAIAVLPFENLLETGETNPFATGLHNDLLTKLSKLSALTVIARTSVLHYRNQKKSIPEIARELRVGTVVEGSVQSTAERVRLNIQLTDARNEQLLWADTYDRKLTADNLFDIQNELAEKIVKILRAKFTNHEKEQIEEKPTGSLSAYHFYTQGRTHIARRTEHSILQGFTYFQQAIKQDADYALAWAGLAEALALLQFYNYSAPAKVPDAMETAQKALELAPELGEAHASLGILYTTRKEGPNAIKELKRARELQPSYAEAHNWLGWMYMTLGEPKKALPPAERSAELDPMAPYVRAYVSKIYLTNSEYDKAFYEAKSARKIQPELALTHYMEGLTLYHLNRFSEAQFALKEALSLAKLEGIPSKSEVRAAFALTCIALGNHSKAEKLLAKIGEDDDLFSAGLAQAALGKSEDAIKNFSIVKDWDYFSTASFRYFFPKILNPLRETKRYKQILLQVDKSWGIESTVKEKIE